MIYIRADGNGEIGTGHIMRCLSIAEEYRRQGGEAIFLTADECAGDLIEKKGFSYISLNSAWNNLEQEIDKLVKFIKQKQVSLLLVDTYFVTQKYLSALRECTKVAYIDDLDQFIYPVDLLINYNIYAEQANYSQRYKVAGVAAELVLGCNYVPLRKEFRGRKCSIPEQVRKVLITTGGTDSYDMTGHLLEYVYKQPWFGDLNFEVIVGRFNSHNKELKIRWKECGNICFHYNVTNMADYMTECDIAVTAGGSTIYELMACGTPAIVYTLADNQRDIAKTVSEMDLMPWAGDVRGDIKSVCCSVAAEIGNYSEADRRRLVSEKMQKLVDGKGSVRLVNVLIAEE